MRLVCPSCSATYRVDAASIGAQGRMVRCAKCGAEWFQAPAITDEDLNPPLTPEPAPAPEPPAPDPVRYFDDVVEPPHDPRAQPADPVRSEPVYSDPVYDVSTGEVRAAEYSVVQIEEDTRPSPAFVTPSQSRIEDPLAELKAPPPERVETDYEPAPRGGGRVLAGFSTVAVLAVVAVGVYLKAPALAEVAPAAAPALETYVQLVDQGRAALAALIG